MHTASQGCLQLCDVGGLRLPMARTGTDGVSTMLDNMKLDEKKGPLSLGSLQFH